MLPTLPLMPALPATVGPAAVSRVIVLTRTAVVLSSRLHAAQWFGRGDAVAFGWEKAVRSTTATVQTGAPPVALQEAVAQVGQQAGDRRPGTIVAWAQGPETGYMVACVQWPEAPTVVGG